MQMAFLIIVFFVKIVSILGSDDNLPLCPTNINYLPQTLPMHCRMPRSVNFPMFPGGMPNFTFPPMPAGYPGGDRAGAPMTFQMPPGLGGPGGLPGPPGMGGAPPMPMHVPMMPMGAPGPAHKVPVIVMPFYSPEGAKKPPAGGSKHKKSKKRRIRTNKKRYPSYHSDSDDDTDTSDTDDSGNGSGDSSADTDGGFWGGRRRAGRGDARRRVHKRRRHKANNDFLTPIIQYITKDGYVIFEKKISKDQANDWLQEKKEINERDVNDPPIEENQWKDEEDDVLREYYIGNTETPKRTNKKNSGTKKDDELDKLKIRVHKNRRKPQTPSHQANHD